MGVQSLRLKLPNSIFTRKVSSACLFHIIIILLFLYYIEVLTGYYRLNICCYYYYYYYYCHFLIAIINTILFFNRNACIKFAPQMRDIEYLYERDTYYEDLDLLAFAPKK